MPPKEKESRSLLRSIVKPVTNYLKFYFAQNGNKESVPDDSQPDGTVSWESGYGEDYSKDPLADGKYILRAPFNSIISRLSQEIQYSQLMQSRPWDPAIQSLGGYMKGSRCFVWYNLSTYQLDQSGENNALCVPIPVISMKTNNQTNPYDPGAVNTDWYIDDGRHLGSLLITDVNLSNVPDGYLDIGSSSSSQVYNKADYPRVQSVLGSGSSSTWGHFRSTSSSQFEVIQRRGYFPRIWNNGGSIDSSRSFSTLQNDAIRNITGKTGYITRNDGQCSNIFQTGIAASEGYYTGNSLFEGCFELDVENWTSPSNRSDLNNVSTVYPSKLLRLIIDASKLVPTSNENRPYNTNIKAYVKI